MKKNLAILFTALFSTLNIFAQTVSATFSIPDTICVNKTFTIQNTSTGSISSYYWSFCSGSGSTTPTSTNIGNPGNLSMPVYYSMAKEANNYYAFVCNNFPGGLVRLFYGSSYLNTPTVTMLGNLGVLPPSFEDLHLEKENGIWYGIAVGGISGGVYRLNFGASLANTPVATSLGSIGSLNYPQRLQIFWTGGNCYGFTPNRNNNTITRFNFGSSIANLPSGQVLSTVNSTLGLLNIPDDIAIINYSGNWYGYVINEGGNTITRLDFGNSLLNNPSPVNLGNTGALDGPRGIDVYVDCGEVKGLIVNRYGNDLLKMNFNGGPTGTLTTTSLGNIANFSFPHSIERFRSGDTLYAIIPNVNNNSLSRIYWPNCTNSLIASSTIQNPPPVSYNLPGTYNISLILNETAINQATNCKQIVVVDTPPILTVTNKTICAGSSAILNVGGANTYSWSTGHSASTVQVSPTITTNYTVTGANNYGCISAATMQIVTLARPLLTVSNKTICAGSKAILNVGGANTYSWSTGHSASTVQVSPTITTNYTVTGTNSLGCTSTATMQVVLRECVGLEEYSSRIGLKIYPNPGIGIVEITTEYVDADFVLLNEIGQQVAEIALITNNGHKMKLTGLDSGFYYLVSKNNSKGAAMKIIVTQ